MSFTLVYAGTRQPLHEGMRVYAVEIGDDAAPRLPAVLIEVGGGGAAGAVSKLRFPRGVLAEAKFEPKDGAKVQVIAVSSKQDFGSHKEAYHALRRCPALSFADGRVPAVAVAGVRPDTLAPPLDVKSHVLRFRALAKDGDELLSSAMALHDAGTGPVLAYPRWGAPAVRCGEMAAMKVFARRGSSVHFDVEAQEGSAWKVVGSVSAAVTNQQASASWLVPRDLLPAAKSAGEESTPGKKLRLNAMAEFEHLLSASCDLLPPPAPRVSNPRWARDAGGQPVFEAGGEVEMLADAAGLDGKKVKFSLEAEAGGNWSAAGEATVEVKGGQARGRVAVKQAQAAGKQAAPPRPKLRFKAELV